MASNMDEEQSLRECEAYVQMHGEWGRARPGSGGRKVFGRNVSQSLLVKNQLVNKTRELLVSMTRSLFCKNRLLVMVIQH
jgi:hypothetical protein